MTKTEILERLKIDMETRNRRSTTVKDYQRKIKAFQDYHDKPADQMREPEINEFLHHLIIVKKLNPESVNTFNTAIRFVYYVTLDVMLNLKKIPRLNHTRSIPELPTKDELQHIFSCCSNLRDKAILMTLYGSGLRISEAVNLKISDIDGKSMRLFIRKGKGSKDRFALLPQKTLDILREYWKSYRPNEWLFVTYQGTKMSTRAIQVILSKAVKKSDVKKHITPHTLRHCFATHMLEGGGNIYHIKRLLGHSKLETTSWYLNLAESESFKLTNPLDTMVYNND